MKAFLLLVFVVVVSVVACNEVETATPRDTAVYPTLVPTPQDTMPPTSASAVIQTETTEPEPTKTVVTSDIYVSSTATFNVVTPCGSQRKPIPHLFVGSVYIDGVRATENAVVVAILEGLPSPDPKARGMVDINGGYSLLVNQFVSFGNLPICTKITFSVNGFLADETTMWQEGEGTELDLHVSTK